MTILVIDGRGGNVGRQLVKMISERFPEEELIAIGTNAMATENMLRGGAKNAATGENAVIVACRRADVIVGSIGIAIADALMGEVTPAMALAVAQSRARRVLIPMNRCETQVAGIGNIPLAELLEDAVRMIEQQKNCGQC